MEIQRLTDTEKPSFCWDRDWTVGDIRRRLRDATGLERLLLIGRIVREGIFQGILEFLLAAGCLPIARFGDAISWSAQRVLEIHLRCLAQTGKDLVLSLR